MISFIIIGRNEGWKLTKCLDSIYLTIQNNSTWGFEIIYVDSKSSDDSIKRAQKFKEIKVFQITGYYNAAIARNIGALESYGDILFFIDGDIEIEPTFLQETINESGKLLYDCITGHIEDLFYDINGKILGKFPRTYKNSIPIGDQILFASGGIFIIKRNCWIKVKGMKTKYKRSQDIDLSLRLTKMGVKTIRIPFLIGKHHTTDYRNDKRMWEIIYSRNEYYPALLFKNHIINYKVVLHTLRSHYTSFLLVFIFLSFFINTTLFKVSIFLYIGILFIRVFSNTLKAATSKNKIFYYFERIFLQFSRDIIFWFAFLFFYPSEKEIKYTRVL